jgi:hypothetical protein
VGPPVSHLYSKGAEPPPLDGMLQIVNNAAKVQTALKLSQVRRLAPPHFNKLRRAAHAKVRYECRRTRRRMRRSVRRSRRPGPWLTWRRRRRWGRHCD